MHGVELSAVGERDAALDAALELADVERPVVVEEGDDERERQLELRAPVAGAEAPCQEQDVLFGYNSATDELINMGYGVAGLRQVGGDLGKNRWMNTYISGNYSFNNKLFLTAEAALDASSRFGKEIPGALAISGNKFAVLPSLGAAWILSSENFMNSLPVVASTPSV